MPEIVGHKTFSDGQGGFRHEPLYADEAAALMKLVKEDEARIAALMPDEASALRMMTDAFYRLKDFGWREAIYCPKDGSSFEVVEAGSSGIHRAHYSGEWPRGTWWIEAEGDLCPSHPVLHRLFPEDEAKRRAKMAEAAARFRAEASD